jgi:hypothetical protein
MIARVSIPHTAPVYASSFASPIAPERAGPGTLPTLFPHAALTKGFAIGVRGSRNLGVEFTPSVE